MRDSGESEQRLRQGLSPSRDLGNWIHQTLNNRSEGSRVWSGLGRGKLVIELGMCSRFCVASLLA